MGFISDITKSVRGFFAQDKETAPARVAVGSASDRFTGSASDMINAMGGDGLAEFLRLDVDLLSRMADYEDMDDYALLASALDIFADDASQPNQPLNRTVWVTSQDQTVQTVMDDLFHRTLRMDEEVWEITRNLVKYGGGFEELVVTQNGVESLVHLPTPTMRRVEGPRGDLLGFVQDFSGRLHFSPDELRELFKQRHIPSQSEVSASKKDPNDLSLMTPQAGFDYPVDARVSHGPQTHPSRVHAFEGWEVVNFRLRGKQRRSLYGQCLAGSSRVWTPSGLKAIKDIRAGDTVFTRHAGRLLSTVVLDQVCNESKPVVRLKTKHREIVLTAEHPVLAVRRSHGRNAWVPVKNLKAGDAIVAVASMPEVRPPPALGLHLTALSEPSEVRLTSRGVAALRSACRFNKYSSRSDGLRGKALALGISRSQTEELLEGKNSISLTTARKLFENVGLPFFDGAVVLKSPDSRLVLPDFMEPWFARLWGFLVGDGWLTDGQVCFARGVREDRNEFYEGLLARTGLTVGYSKPNDRGWVAQAYVSSVELVRVMRLLGWTDGAHTKRLPAWIYNLSEEFRTEFLAGFEDADGWVTLKGRYNHIEICNEPLLRDIKNLIDGLGWTSGNIRSRAPRRGSFIDGREVLSSGSFLLTYRKDLLRTSDAEFVEEVVQSIESHGEELVYDIEVSNAGHNFVAEGLVVHNSILDPARWIFKRLALLEDAALIYRLQRAPERFAFYIDVGDVPPQEAMGYLNRVRQQYKKKKWINPTTGRVDLKFETLPIAHDTPIPLLDGRTITIAEMEREHARGIKHWVYSIDRKTQQPKPGEVEWVGKTRENSAAVKITFDDGGTATMAPEHCVMRRDGSYVEAQNLKPGDSVMPFYRELSPHNPAHGFGGYEMIYDPSTTDEYRYTHRIVREAPAGLRVHHSDRNKFNNSPNNLVLVTNREHGIIHGDTASQTITRYNKSPEKRARTSELNRLHDSGRFIRAYNASPKHAQDNAKRSVGKTEFWKDPVRKQAAKEKMRISFPSEFVEGLRTFIRAHQDCGAQDLVEHVNSGSLLQVLAQANPGRKFPHVHRMLTLKAFRAAGFESFADFKAAALKLNHKVVSVEVVPNCDHYCMSVKTWHNFALCLRNRIGIPELLSGVFVKNSPDEDFFVATRKGQDSARIETLGAPQWQSMEDIEYFQNILFSAIKIPRAYLAQDDVPNRAVLSSQDVRFARTVLRIQREIRNGLGKIGRIHLSALNIDPRRVDYDIHMTIPSAVFELAQMEIRNARADLANRMQGFVSMQWMLSQIFGMSDKDIETVFKQRIEDDTRNQISAAQAQMAAQELMNQAQPPEDQGVPEDEAPPQEGLTRANTRLIADAVSSGEVNLARTNRRGRISEQELFQGDREAERRAADQFHKLMESDRRLAQRMDEIGGMLRELKVMTVRR